MFVRFIVQSEIVVTFIHRHQTISAQRSSSGQSIVFQASKTDFSIALP